ncbi:hypothetical protein FB107DRAFT_271902 [Schizophyllum commune]
MQATSRLHHDHEAAHTTSHISSLPTELLRLVFIHFRGDRHLDPSASDPVWKLLHVCKRWRDVAQAQSSLWCRINTVMQNWLMITVHPLSDRRVALICKVLERYLINSHDHPLDIDSLWICQDSWWRPVVELLCRHQARWRDVTVRDSGVEQLVKVAKASLSVESSQAVPLPLLRSFRKITQGAVDLSCLAQIMQAPGLFILKLCPDIAHAPPHALPWAQITRYQGASYSKEGHQFLLSYMPNLKTCAVQGNSRAPDSLSPVRCQLLRLWSLGLDSSDWCLPYLEAPVLGKLRSYAGDNRALFDFLTRSGRPSLTALSTAYGAQETGDDHLCQIICLCPALRVLSLRAAGDSPTDIFALLANTSAPVLSQLAVLLIEPWEDSPWVDSTAAVSERFVLRVMQFVQRLVTRETCRLQSVVIYTDQERPVHDQVLSISRHVLGAASGVLTVCTDFESYWGYEKEHFRELDCASDRQVMGRAGATKTKARSDGDTKTKARSDGDTKTKARWTHYYRALFLWTES